MKNTIKTLLAGLLLFMPAAAFLRAQTNQDGAPSISVAATTSVANPAPAPVSFPPVNTPKSPDFHADAKDVLGICAVFGMPVLIVALALFFKYRRDRLAHETLRAMIEKGVPITPELLAQLKSKDPGDSQPKDGSRHLLPGLICSGVGIALLIGNLNSNRSGIPGIPAFAGWIVLFVGVAFLIVWWVERKNKNDAQPPRS
jgi:Domain of unknown function (DUF6249)